MFLLRSQNIPKTDLVTIDFGLEYELHVTYDPMSYKFKTRLNTESLSDYTIPTQEFVFGDVKAEGKIGIDFMGFPFDGKENC